MKDAIGFAILGFVAGMFFLSLFQIETENVFYTKIIYSLLVALAIFLIFI